MGQKDFLTAVSTMLTRRGTSTFCSLQIRDHRKRTRKVAIVPSWLTINRPYQQLRLTDRFVRAERNATHLIQPIN